MSKKVAISVIVPVYNTSKYIIETIESLINQTFKDFEVLFIDDGSVDGSGAIITGFIKNNKIKNMKYIYQDNSGPSVARNKGIDMSQGEFIYFVDSDDKIPPTTLENMYKKAIDNNANIVLGGTYRFDSESEWKINSHFYEEGFKDIFMFNQIFWSMGPCNKLYRKSMLEDIRFPIDLSYGEDQYFVMNAYLKSRYVYTINEVVYYYRQQDIEEGSLTSQEVTNPNNVLRQVFALWNKISQSIDMYVDNVYIQNFIKSKYLNRLINVNIWPPLKNSIDTKDDKTQVEALKATLEFIKTINKECFNDLFILHRLCTAWIIDRFNSLSSEARFVYMDILNHFFKTLDNKAYVKIEKKYSILVPVLKKASNNNSQTIIKKYLFKRKLKKTKVKTKENLKIKLRNPILKIGYTLRPIDKNKLILASNKSDSISGNLACIETKTKELKPEIKISCYPAKKRSLTETLKMYWDCSNAKTIVFDDYYNQLYNAKLSKDTSVVQIWHACGAFKRFGFSALERKDSNSVEFEKAAHSHYTHVIASSTQIIPHYSEAFNIDKSKVLPIGVPRTDILFDKQYIESVKESVTSKYPILKDKKIILYAPTFRGNTVERKKFNMQLDYKYWCENIPEDTILVLKMHPSVTTKLVIPEEYSNKIIDITKGVDVQDLLMVSDVLITDYSSIVFDFSLLNKPTVFFAYDLEDYIDERNFYYDYEDFVPGKIVKTTEDLVDVLVKESYDNEKLKAFNKRFFDDFDGKSTERFIETFL